MKLFRSAQERWRGADEATRRESNNLALRLHNAGFPTMKNIDDYDFSELRMPASMTKEQIMAIKNPQERHKAIAENIEVFDQAANKEGE